MINQDLWNTLKQLSPADVEQRSLARYDAQKKVFTLKICHRDYLFHPEEQLIAAADSPPEPPVFFLQLAAVNYLIGAKKISLDGRWVDVKEFPSGPLFFRGPHEMPEKKIKGQFGQDCNGFINAGQKLAGIQIGGGDVAFELHVFPRLPVRLILWLADEEFPARLTYLFDRTANIHLHLDGIWAVGKLIEALLTS